MGKARTIAFLLLLWVLGACQKASSPGTPAATIAADQITMPDAIPPIQTTPIAADAVKRANAIAGQRFCLALGKSIRAKNASAPTMLEFRRAMLMRAARDFNEILSFADQTAIANKNPQLGMGICAVVAALGRYPERDNVTETVHGRHDQLVFGDGMYFYFDNGILTSRQY